MPTQDILKQLVSKVDAYTPSKVFYPSRETLDEVVFESDIDGVRYYVVRSQPKLNKKIKLSPREKAIAQLVSQGLPNKSIGDRLDISPWTVATYLRRLFAKVGVTSRSAMIARLAQENLLYD